MELSIKEQLMADMKTAMKAKEEGRLALGVIRMARAHIRQAEIDDGHADFDDDQVLAVLRKEVKQRKETLAEIKDSGRDDLVAEAEKMLSVVLKDTEDVWHEKFSEINKNYEEPKLHFFEGAVSTGCGNADKNVGPFYCSLDQTVYMDVTFYNMLTQKLGADGGDYAMAYVLAHEVGHHVQKELGILDRVHNIQRRLNEKDANKYPHL